MTRKAYITDTVEKGLDVNTVDSLLLEDSVIEVDSNFKPNENSIQLYVYTLEDSLLESNLDFRDFEIDSTGTILEESATKILINPVNDLDNLGYTNGDLKVKYSFVEDIYGLKDRKLLFVESISPDRTELRVSSLQVTQTELISSSVKIKEELEKSNYFLNLQINFDNDQKINVINLDLQQVENTTYLIIKLYESLPSSFNIGSLFSFEKSVANDLTYTVLVDQIPDEVIFPSLRGPNFNIQDNTTRVSNPTEYLTGVDLKTSNTEQNYQTITEELSKDFKVNVDYTDLGSFVHFSSAEERLRNFKFKLDKLSYLETEKSKATNLEPITLRTSTVKFLEQEITSVLKTFDHYDKFLFFESGSLSWPKVDSNYPYLNQTSSTAESLSFYNTKLQEAALFDQNNIHRLTNSIPEYIRDDEENTPYLMFIDMIGEHFDNLWLYANSVSEKYNADNRLDYGISKDLVADALRGFGIKLYDSDLSFDSLFKIFTGETYNTGSEEINTFITASNIPTSFDSYQKQVYKRLYHNLPYLLKSKGTERGVRGLINLFGIPEETLQIRYFGGNNTQEIPFYGPYLSVTSSLDKIRLDNTGSNLPEKALSYYTKTVLDDKKYTQDLHTLHVGFSPTDNVDSYLISGSYIDSTFDIDDYIGDPRLRYNKTYPELEKYAEDVIKDNIENRYDVYDFIRLLKFFDNTLFKMIKDFVPARTNVSTGVIIKPNILERNKINQVEPKWSKQTIFNSGSKLDFGNEEYTTNFYFDESISIGELTGRDGGSFKEGRVEGTFDEFTFVGEYDTSYTYRIKNPAGRYGYKRSRDEAKYTGEFAGRVIKVVTTEGGEPTPTPTPTVEGCYIEDGYVEDGYVVCVESTPTPTPTPSSEEGFYIQTGYVQEGYVETGEMEIMSFSLFSEEEPIMLFSSPEDELYVEQGYAVEGYIQGSVIVTPVPTPTPTVTEVPEDCYVEEGYVEDGYVICIPGGTPTPTPTPTSPVPSILGVSFETEPSFILVTDGELNRISRNKNINKVNNNFKKSNIQKYQGTSDNISGVINSDDTPSPTPTPTVTTTSPVTPTPTPTPTPTSTSITCFEFPNIGEGLDASLACADYPGLPTIYGDTAAFDLASNFYTNSDCSTPFDGNNRWYSNGIHAVRISSLGVVTDSASCTP